MEDFKVTYKNNREQQAVFEGPILKVLEWLLNNAAMAWDLEVWNGATKSYVDAEDFVRAHAIPNQSRSPEIGAFVGDSDRQMSFEHMTDSLVRARNEMVRQYVARAMRLVNEPGYDSEILAMNTAHNIIRLFY